MFHNLLTPMSSESSMSVNSPFKSHSIFVKISRTPAFHYISLFLTVANSIYLGIDIDRNRYGEDFHFGDKYFYEALAFAILFTIEISFRILAYKTFSHYLNDPTQRKWNIYDLFFLAIVLLESFVFPWLLTPKHEYILRPLRLIRLMRIFRLYLEFPLMARLVRSIVSSVWAVSIILAMQLYLMYLVSLIIVNWSRSNPKVYDLDLNGHENIFYEYFSQVPVALLTMFQFFIVDTPFVVLDGAIHTEIYVGVILMVYFGVCTMIIYNLLIGGVCRAVSDTAITEKETDATRVIKRSFKRGDPLFTGEVSLVNYEIKVRPKLYRSEEINDAVADIAKSISIVEHDSIVEGTYSDDGFFKQNAPRYTVSRQAVNTEIFIQSYLKLTKPFQAQDLATCLSELETFYKLIDDSLINS